MMGGILALPVRTENLTLSQIFIHHSRTGESRWRDWLENPARTSYKDGLENLGLLPLERRLGTGSARGAQNLDGKKLFPLVEELGTRSFQLEGD